MGRGHIPGQRVFSAGLNAIPSYVYEAAEVDGASKPYQFFFITLPLLTPVLTFALVLSIIGSLQLFAEPFLITAGGPGAATETLGYFLYTSGFQTVNFGYASAIAILMSGVLLILSLPYIVLVGRERG